MTQPLPPSIFTLSKALADCLCATLNAPSSPYMPVCRCCVRHSDTVPPADICDCGCTVAVGDQQVQGNGEAWVRLVSYQPRPQLAARRTASGKLCSPTESEITFQIGIYRCIEGTIGENGELPACNILESDALMLDQDAAAMWKAALCCETTKPYDPVVVRYDPIGPSGGCAGGALTVTYTVPLIMATP